jgi:peptide/nickel transport system substrate-binding protein
MLPKHRLEDAFLDGSLADAWGVTTPLESMAGLGPFVLSDYRPGQRLVFARNLYYWRVSENHEQLPRLDRLTLEIVPDQDVEMLRLSTGAIDFTQSEVRAEDYASLRRAADKGQAQLIDLGVALDADFLFFNLRPDAMADDPRRSWLQADDFRRAVSHAVDRKTFADTVYLGLGEPVHGPVTPSNHRWYYPDVRVYEYDLAKTRDRLMDLGLKDRDQDGVLEDAAGEPVRFTLLTQRGHTARERAAAVIAEDLRRVGITVDVVALEFGALIERISVMDFDAAYLGFRASDTDPAANLDLWLSGSAFHFWNPNQPVPATDWERRIDELMMAQVATSNEAERKRLFNEVQQIFAEHVPAIYFAAPRVVIATSPRVANARPALLEPFMLWNADDLAGGTPSVLSSSLSP